MRKADTSSNTREQILSAAEQIVVRDGVKNLTIENVANEAKISRGGVLYHYASKDALIQGMLDRLVEQFEMIINDEVANDPEHYGRYTRAFARATLRMDEDTASVFAPLLAAISYNPDLIHSFNQRWQAWQQQMEQEIDPVKGAVVQLASHALWLNDLLLRQDFSVDRKREIVAYLVRLTLPDEA
jgi:AcrR family transcriptional regulator